MLKDLGYELDAVVSLTAARDELVSRLLQRAHVEGRADDTEAVIRRRQEVYEEQTAPLIAVYRERGLLVEVDGMGEIDGVTHRIFTALDEKVA
jgi:adenylate kinase